MALNYKRIPFTTEWTEYPDIASKFKTLGMAPNPQGGYTCPAISDSSTSPPTLIMDSAAIATYLDTTYLSRPLYTGSPESRAAQKQIGALALEKIQHPIRFIMLSSVAANLPPRSAAYFRRTREEAWGCSLEDFIKGDKLLKEWQDIEEGLKDVNDAINKAQDEGLDVLKHTGENGKEEITYCALTIASMLIWVERFGPAGSWSRIKESQGGLWGTLFDAGKPYM